MTKTESMLLRTFAKNAGSGSFYRSIENALRKAASKGDLAHIAEIIALNDRLVKSSRWNLLEHLHLTHRKMIPPKTRT